MKRACSRSSNQKVRDVYSVQCGSGLTFTVDKSRTPVFDIPSIREYFVDLEKVLAVICDGPTKSFAFRRLNYLTSKFTMYSLLNEQQELAEMKSVPHRYHYIDPPKLLLC